ncbi:MAG: hypothetical protein ACP5KS_13545 [Candidatus Hydrogenedens sp.]
MRLVFLILLCFLSNNSENKSLVIEPQEKENLIGLIKNRLNIQSIKCDYNSVLIINPDFTQGETVEIKRNFRFKYQNGNFVNSYIRKNKNSSVPEKDNPKNIMESIIKKFHENSVYKKSNYDNSEHIENFYFYNNIGKRRNIILYKKKDAIIEEVPAILGGHQEYHHQYARSGDPRWIIGYIGFNLDSTDYLEDYSPLSCPPQKITELFESPGETIVRREENYRVLFHCVKKICKDSKCGWDKKSMCKFIEEYKKTFSFEVWIDEHDNIAKIIEIDYFPIIYGKEFVQKLCGYDPGKYFPYEIRRIFTFENFKEYPSGVRVPLKTNVVTYRNTYLYTHILDNSFPELNELVENFENKKINASEFRVLSHCLGPREDIYFSTNYIEIDPETLKVNEAIPETEFIAPEPVINHLKEAEKYEKYGKVQKKEEQEKENNYKKPIIFVMCFLGVTLVILFITRKYLGWGI